MSQKGRAGSLARQYRRIQEDLEAFVTRPPRMRLNRRYVETLKWYEGRLAALERQMTQS